LAHDTFEHHAPGHHDFDCGGLQFLVGLGVEVTMQTGGQMAAAEVVRIRVALCSQFFQLGPPLRDDLVLVRGFGWRFFAVVVSHVYTPCLREALMKSSRSPSSTDWVSPLSTLVRRSLMRDW